jgi:hypothetical protein
MDVLAALLPPVVVAIAFIALLRTVLRHTDGSPGSQREEEEAESAPDDPMDDGAGSSSGGNPDPVPPDEGRNI